MIGSIAFLARFGSTERGNDVENMIERLETGLRYVSTICFLPELHKYLLGNPQLIKVLNCMPAVRAKDPFPTILKVRARLLDEIDSTKVIMQVTRTEIAKYDEEQVREETCCHGLGSKGLGSREE